MSQLANIRAENAKERGKTFFQVLDEELAERKMAREKRARRRAASAARSNERIGDAAEPEYDMSSSVVPMDPVDQ